MPENERIEFMLRRWPEGEGVIDKIKVSLPKFRLRPRLSVRQVLRTSLMNAVCIEAQVNRAARTRTRLAVSLRDLMERQE